MTEQRQISARTVCSGLLFVISLLCAGGSAIAVASAQQRNDALKAEIAALKMEIVQMQKAADTLDALQDEFWRLKEEKR